MAEVATLQIGQPTARNDGNLTTDIVLFFFRDQGIETSFRKGEEMVVATIDIYLNEVFLVIESDNWRPDLGSIFGRSDSTLKDFPVIVTAGQIPGSVRIAAKDPDAPLLDSPFNGPYTSLMTPRDPKISGEITFAVRAYQDAIRISVRGAAPSAEKEDVMNAILASAIKRDRRKRFMIASETVKCQTVREPK